MKFIILASGSKGNSTLVINENKDLLLIDVGISYKEIKEKINRYGYSIDDIKNVLITHEHDDHIKSINSFYNAKIYSLKDIKVANNIFFKRQLLLKKGQVATARVETYLTKGMNGFPAEIMLDEFEIEGIKTSQLLCNYTKKGISFAYLVFPIKWALTPIPFVGSLTNLIMGTNATIEAGDEITVQYFPNWK